MIFILILVEKIIKLFFAITLQQQERILLANEEMDFLRATSKILCENGYKCNRATDSNIKIVRKKHYNN